MRIAMRVTNKSILRSKNTILLQKNVEGKEKTFLTKERGAEDSQFYRIIFRER